MKKEEKLPIPENELKPILQLHQRRLGWSFLLGSTIADRQVGFPCEAEELFFRQKLKEAFSKVNTWFRKMSLKNNWPSKKGWGWEVDFSSGHVFFKELNAKENGTPQLQEQDNTECDHMAERPIMIVGDMEAEIIKHLIEERQASADTVRTLSRHFFDGKVEMDKLQGLVQNIGAITMKVNDWFSEMAKMYKWPKVYNGNWSYRIDTAEKKVYLDRVS